MMLPEQDNIFYIDSAGLDQPVKPEDLTDRLASQSFLQALLLEVSHMSVFVVNSLTLNDQIYIKSVQDHLEMMGTRKSPWHNKLVIVHNFKDLESVDDVLKKIKTDLTICGSSKAYNASVDGKHVHYWREVVSNPSGTVAQAGVRHVVLAKDGSEAGNAFNAGTIKLLKSWFTSSFSEEKELITDTILGRLLEFCEHQLPAYFTIQNQDKDKLEFAVKLDDGSPHPHLKLDSGTLGKYKEGLDLHPGKVVSLYQTNTAPAYEMQAFEKYTIIRFFLPGVKPGATGENGLQCKIHPTRLRAKCTHPDGFGMVVFLAHEVKKTPHVLMKGSWPLTLQDSRSEKTGSAQSPAQLFRRPGGKFEQRITLPVDKALGIPYPDSEFISWANGVVEVKFSNIMSDEEGDYDL